LKICSANIAEFKLTFTDGWQTIFEKLLISVFIKKEAKKEPKIEISQMKFLVAKRSQKKPKSRNWALLTPNWQPWSISHSSI
jgi:hypothetical protein